MNPCIKTGCAVLVKGATYHGDLFLDSNGFFLVGVPKLSNGKFCEALWGRKYHCESNYIEFFGTDAKGYGRFHLGEIIPLPDFLDEVKKWSPYAVKCFSEIHA